MKLAIASSTLSGDLPEKLQAAAKAGFAAVEVFEKDLLYADLSPADLRGLADSLGLELITLQSLGDFEGLPEAARDKALGRAGRKFHLMQGLGAGILLVTSNTLPDAVGDPAVLAADLAALADAAAGQGLRIAYEPLPWAQHVRDIETAFTVVSLAGRDNLGLVLDSFTFFAVGSALECLTPALLSKVMLVQLADSPDINIDVQQLDRHFRCYAGQGVLPLVDFVARLRAAGYDGIISQEVPCEEFRANRPQQIARDGYRSLLWILEKTDPARASDALSGSLLGGVEFVELASQGGEAVWLEQLLVALGFRKTHAHKSKQVVLYRQGQINFVVNREPDSFANAHYEMHGTSVCALGLACPQLARVLERCQRYRCDFVQSAILPDEMPIPAIRTVGEGLLYLVDTAAGSRRFFEVDFVPLAGVPDDRSMEVAGIGLTHIDHITQAVASAEFLSIIQFHNILFGLEANPEYDLIDRNGIVHSRSLVNADHSVQFPINTSHARESSTERFRARFSGSGIQHIALRCADIFAVAPLLNPSHILPITPNYYEEAQAEFLLDDALIERMRPYHILYDANEQGSFFHIYTRHINGLFFEIVQRDGYNGFGERNATARLAAQAREYQKMQDLLLVG